jgi:integrase/recombinase XerD
MSELLGHVEDYLKLRRALGFKLEREGQLLPQFVAYLEAAGTATVTSQLAIAWAQLPQNVLPINWAHRLGAVRGFARYLQTIDPATEVPPRDVFPTSSPRPSPYLWSDHDIARLLTAARQLPSPLRAVTFETLFALVAVTGLRISEALRLERDHVDLDQGVLSIHKTKFERSRLVPLHATTTEALRGYDACRDRLCPTPVAPMFFVSTTGTALRKGGVQRVFVELTRKIGLRTETVRPRVHDLRHSVAVRTLIDWHRDGIDVDAAMPLLSTYLGHINPAGTYWYLSAAPELMELAAARLDDHYEARP